MELKGLAMLTGEEITKINNFQEFLFFTTLNIVADKTKSIVSNTMLVVPLIKGNPIHSVIYLMLIQNIIFD